MASLEEMPRRCPLIPEYEEIEVEVRQLLFGKRPHVYRILFDIQEPSDGEFLVRILRVRHGAQDKVRPEDILLEEG